MRVNKNNRAWTAKQLIKTVLLSSLLFALAACGLLCEDS